MNRVKIVPLYYYLIIELGFSIMCMWIVCFRLIQVESLSV